MVFVGFYFYFIFFIYYYFILKLKSLVGQHGTPRNFFFQLFKMEILAINVEIFRNIFFMEIF